MWDRFNKSQSSPGAAGGPVSNGPALSSGAEARVRQLLANGKDKAAVEAAKDIHKARPTAESETLLLDAYAARIQSLTQQNLAHEAKALLELVCERFPSARERLMGRHAPAGIDSRRIDDLVRPLSNPELPVEERTAIEAAVAREVGDLAALAECTALPAEHPLRTAASALQRAFLAATSGPVDEQAVELPEVSRRSPLAPWKLLVRAIACFYRGEDEACMRYLEAIKPETAPARVVPALQAMLGGNQAGLTPAACALVSYASLDATVLPKTLAALDRVLRSGKDGAILKSIREAVQACREIAPDQIEKLKQHIAVLAALAEVKVDKVQAAMGGSSRHDAYFFRLFARGLQEADDPGSIVHACRTWEEFRQAALSEGWFAANGPEAATLYLHIADVLRKVPREVLPDIQESIERQHRKSGVDLYYLYPEKLYQRACALDPHFDSFSRWMDWAKRGREAETVAAAWHKARPADIEPILFLMEEKEKRNAFHTSLQYLAKAERIDSVHPAVRRARLRLLAGSALRHIQQKKLNLVEEKLAEMEALPQSRQGDRPAFLAALRYMHSVVRGAPDQAASHRAEMERVLGSKTAAALLILGVAGASKQSALEQPPPIATLGSSDRSALPEAVIRVTELARDMRMNQPVPMDWLSETSRQFERNHQSLTIAQLHTLAEAGLVAGQSELAYAVSVAGLDRGGPSEASFLLVRAQSIPKIDERWTVCAVAAAHLARQQRDMDVLEKAVELIAGSPFDDLTLTPEQVSKVMRTEKTERRFPTLRRPGPDYTEFLGLGELDEFDEDEADYEEFDDLLNSTPLPPDMPPEIAKLLFNETRKAVERGESLESLLNRVFGPQTRSGGRGQRGKRR